MIELKKYEARDHEGLLDLCSKEQVSSETLLEHLSTTYIISDRDQVLGFAYYIKKNNDIYLKDIYISKNERNHSFGDGLFRTVLNALMLQGHFKVYMEANPIYKDFLIKEDLSMTDGKYCIDLNEFFNRKCKSKK
jgi:hypothetical protein